MATGPPHRGHRAATTGINARVTIRTKEPEVPSEFPPSRLFLDDIEEIVRTLVDANKKPDFLAPQDEDAKIKVTFTIKDQACDEVEELPKIANKTTELSILLEWETGLIANSLTFHREGTFLSTFSLAEEGHLRLFHKLTPIFKRRNLWLRTLVWSHRTFFIGMLSVVVATMPVVTIMLGKHIPLTPTIAAALLFVSMITTLAATAFRHSISLHATLAKSDRA